MSCYSSGRCYKSSSYFIISLNLLISLSQILYGIFCLVYMYMTNTELTLGQQNITIPALVHITAGIVIVFVIALGCCGITKEITCCVTFYSVLLLLIAASQIAMGIFAVMTFSENNQDLQNQIREEMDIAYLRYNQSPQLVHNIQSMIHCCGKDSPSDIKWNTTMAISCCADIFSGCHFESETLYRSGCVNKVISFIISNNTIIGYWSILSGMILVIESILGFCIVCNLIKYGTTETM